jgi:RNA polymerase sigma factor (sigma-70 family)
MIRMDDLQLLRQYAQQGSQAAFSELVSRNVNLVYSAVLRQVRSPAIAEEITQVVFLELSQQANRLRSHSHVGSWLYVVARRKAVDAIRRESRRQTREQTALKVTMLSESKANWSQLEPILDKAITSLSEGDRRALMLRFFEKQSFREIGYAMHVSEEAAQKRVQRSVDRLRLFFRSRGLPTTVSTLVADIIPQAVHTAPTGLALSISAAVALSRVTIPPTLLTKAAHTLAMTSSQKAIIATVAVSLGAIGLYQTMKLRNQSQQIAVVEATISAERLQIRKLTLENRALDEQLARLKNEAVQPPRDESSSDPTALALRSWLARVSQLRQRLSEHPEQKTPELRFAKEQDWLGAARADLTSEDDYRRAMAKLRNSSESNFIPLLQKALRKYTRETSGAFPTDPLQLGPYFDVPVEAEILERYAIVPRTLFSYSEGFSGGQQSIITTKYLIDPQYDCAYNVGLKGNGSQWPSPYSIRDLVDRYFSAKNPAPLTQLDQLASYVTTSAQKSALQQALQISARQPQP